MPTTDKRPLKVFLSYASQDRPLVRELSRRLVGEGWIDTWQDEKSLLPGQDWRIKIEEAVEDADVVIICLSNHSVTKEGHVQKELRYAREIALEKPEEAIFLIPLRLDECEVPRGLRFYQWVDFFGEKKDASYRALFESLKLRYEQKLNLEDAERVRKEKLVREIAERVAREKKEQEVAEKIAREKAEKEAKEKERIEVEKQARKKVEREKAERETAEKLTQEKAAREKAEKEAKEKERLEAEEQARQKAAIEKATRLDAEKTAQEKATREKNEREAAEGIVQEKNEREATEKSKLKTVEPKPVEEKPNQSTATVAKQAVHKTQTIKRINPTTVIGFISVTGFVGFIGLIVIVAIIVLSYLNGGNTPQTTNPTSTRPITSITSVDVTQTKTSITSATSLDVGSTVIGTDGAEYLYIPSGEFNMGTDEQRFTDTNIKPAHSVYLDAYWIHKTEVTNGMYKSCVQDGVCKAPPDYTKRYSDATYDDYPVVYISWDNANTYCKWANAHLPTEAEWEKAARGNSEDFPWGKDLDCSQVNYLGCGDNISAIGSYPADTSPYGVLDLAGNVWEWVSDWYDASYYSVSPLSNPQGPASGNSHVVRGAQWDPYRGIISPRGTFSGSEGDDTLGFRCAMNESP